MPKSEKVGLMVTLEQTSMWKKKNSHSQQHKLCFQVISLLNATKISYDT